MAFWPFGKKKKKQKQENPVESSPLEPKQDQPAAEPEAAPKIEAAEAAAPVEQPVEKQEEKPEAAPASAPVASAAAGVEALTDYDPVGGSTLPSVDGGREGVDKLANLLRGQR